MPEELDVKHDSPEYTPLHEGLPVDLPLRMLFGSPRTLGDIRSALRDREQDVRLGSSKVPEPTVLRTLTGWTSASQPCHHILKTR